MSTTESGQIIKIYDFGYEGPGKDVISADFTAMVGPAEEFGALGYNDVPAGGLFVKPGVGVLKRDAMNYNHSRPYVIANGGKWDVKRSRDAVEFTHTVSEPSISLGYVYTKVVRLTPGKPQMTIAHVMKNTGSKPIVTNVYNHNFTTIDKQPTGPDIEITVPWQMTRAAGRGRGGRARLRARQGAPPPPGPAARESIRPLAAGRAWARSAASRRCRRWPPAGNKLVYSKVLEGSSATSELHRLWHGAEGQRHPHREQEDGRGRSHHGRSAVDAARLLVDPDGRGAGALHRSQHRAGPAVRVDLHI
jgi:hypothetical protein